MVGGGGGECEGRMEGRWEVEEGENVRGGWREDGR